MTRDTGALGENMTTGMQSVLLETLHKVPFPAQLSHLIPRIFVFTRAASSKLGV